VVTIYFLAAVYLRFLKFIVFGFVLELSSWGWVVRVLILIGGRSSIIFLSYFYRDISVRFHYLPFIRALLVTVVL